MRFSGSRSDEPCYGDGGALLTEAARTGQDSELEEGLPGDVRRANLLCVRQTEVWRSRPKHHGPGEPSDLEPPEMV